MMTAPENARLVSLDPRVKLACLLVYIVAALHAHTLPAVLLCAGAVVAAGIATRLPIRSLVAALRPLSVILVFTVIMQVLYLQQGTVLFEIGAFAITREALEQSMYMVFGLVCVMAASVSFMRCTPSAQLVYTLGWALGPLRRLGVRVDAFMLALSVAFRFVPVLVEEFSALRLAQQARLAHFDGSFRNRLLAYGRLFAPLVRTSFIHADRIVESFGARCFNGAAVRVPASALYSRNRAAILILATLAVAIAAFAF